MRGEAGLRESDINDLNDHGSIKFPALTPRRASPPPPLPALIFMTPSTFCGN